MKVALIDGDSIAWRCAASVEKTKYLVVPKDHSKLGDTFCDSYKEAVEAAGEEGEIWSRKTLGTLEEAVANVNSCLTKIAKALAPCDPEIWLSPSVGNFRDRICTLAKYKGNRDFTGRPTYLGDLRDYLESCGACVAEGEEADDAISVRARGMRAEKFVKPTEYVVVSNDKDLNQIPGLHYNWVAGVSYQISEEECLRNIYLQALTGDLTDNVGGCWKIGPKKAMEIIEEWTTIGQDEKTFFSLLVQEYENSQKFKNCPYASRSAFEVARENLSLVRLRQIGDETLWTP